MRPGRRLAGAVVCATALAAALPAIGDATQPGPSSRRTALEALGVPADEPALALAERAERACARTGARADCALADAAYELSAARVALAEALALLAALGLEAPPPPAAPDERAEGAARLAGEAAWVRARVDALHAVAIRAAVPVDRTASFEAARALAGDAGARAASDDDAYRQRRGRRAPPSAPLHRQAIAELERGLVGRIDRLTDAELARALREEHARARALTSDAERLDALLAIDASLTAAARAPE